MLKKPINPKAIELLPVLKGILCSSLIVVTLVFSSYSVSNAQSFDCTPFEFEICKVDPDVSVYPATPSSPNAFYGYYSVRLKVKSGSMVTTLPSSWTFNYLSFYGKIDLNQFTESMDVPWTFQISSGSGFYDYSPYLEVTKDGEVTWRVGVEDNCMESSQQVTLNFPPNVASVELFKIAVKGMSGDQITWTQLGGIVCDNVTYNCDGAIFVDNCTSSTQISFPNLVSCTPEKEITYLLDFIGGQYVIRVFINNITPGGLIRDFDGVIHIEPSMNSLTNLDFILAGAPNINTKLQKNADGTFDIYYFQDQAQTISTSDWEFLSIGVSGIYNFSQGGDLLTTLTAARGAFTENGSIVVCAPTSDPEIINIPGYSDCQSDLSISAEQYDGVDCDLGVSFDISFSGGGQMSLNTMFLNLAFVTEQDQNPPGTPITNLPCPSCWVYTYGGPSGAGELHFWSYENYNPLTIQDGETIDFLFSNTNDCIDYYISMAEAIPAGGTAYDWCAFQTFVDFSEFPACNPEVRGKVYVDDAVLTPAPYYYVNLKNSAGNIVAQTFEDCEEEYSFCPDMTAGPYTLEVLTNPYQEDNYCYCGVTTFDLVLISKHILGLGNLSFPYGQIAADANRSESITTIDIVNIRKCILGIWDDFGNSTDPAWFYINSNFAFDLGAPFTSGYDAANTVSVPSPAVGSYGSFVSVKRGDVNHSCNCDGSKPGPRDVAPTPIFNVTGKLSHFNNNKGTLQIPIYLDSDFDPIAVQFGLRFDPELIKLAKVVPNSENAIDESCFGLTQTGRGEIRFAWYAEDGLTTLSKNSMLFTLEFELVGSNLPENELVWFMNSPLANILYKETGQEIDAQFKWDGHDMEQPSLIMQPNPTNGSTLLFINSSHSENVQVELFDSNGQKLWKEYIDLTKGENTLKLDLRHYNSGIYSIGLRTKQGYTVKRVVKI